MKKTESFFLRILVIIFVLSMQSLQMSAAPAVQGQTAQTSATVAAWLKQAGYNYKKAADNVWLIKQKGSNMPEFNVLVATNENIVIVAVVMANKKNMKLSEDALHKILKQNHEIDFVKIGFDNDEDLFIRTERKIKYLDLEEFKACVGEISEGADRLYSTIKPFLNLSK